MIKDKYEKDLKKFKKYVLDKTREEFESTGKLNAIVFMLYDKNGKIFLSKYPVNEFMEDDDTKEFFAFIMPRLFESIRIKKKAVPIAFSFSSETWVREWPQKKGPLPENWRSIKPKGEAVMSTFETEYASHTVMRNITRGALEARLEQPDKDWEKDAKECGGRFLNLFRKYNTNNLN